mmetsp:Transcript_21753/g.61883  ORF Transcript_21753/g.61883 Transcript_21753/m.61883 type:complete len:156 (+) Transcript_21753:95-562(+)
MEDGWMDGSTDACDRSVHPAASDETHMDVSQTDRQMYGMDAGPNGERKGPIDEPFMYIRTCLCPRFQHTHCSDRTALHCTALYNYRHPQRPSSYPTHGPRRRHAHKCHVPKHTLICTRRQSNQPTHPHASYTSIHPLSSIIRLPLSPAPALHPLS